MREELLKGLTKEQIAKAKACDNLDDLLALAKDEGVELTPEQLEAVSGGMCTVTQMDCPICYQRMRRITYECNENIRYECTNPTCGYVIIKKAR